MNNRIIAFEKILNARDLSGLKTAQGSVVSSGLLLRSANLAEATEKDKSILQEQYHIAKIIDLRTEMERNEKPDVSIPDVEYLSIPIFDESVAGISHEKSLSKEQILASIPKMGQLYRQMVTKESCRQNLGKAARCVMEHDFSKGSVLWHCTEGKDRCGLLSAVLLLALGVQRSTIMEDYMLTNQVNEKKAERYYQMILAAGKTEAEAATIRDMFLAKEEYLKEAFSAIEEQYKDSDTFLREGLNIPQSLIEKFQKSMLL
ncbi:MAG: tyrosine-protein phosphatase [Muricoprocola sp.]